MNNKKNIFFFTKNKNENIIINNTAVTLIRTFLFHDNSQVNKIRSFIKKGKKNINYNQEFKTRLMNKIGKFSVNSEYIDDVKEEMNNNNLENNIYNIDENIEENSKSSIHIK